MVDADARVDFAFAERGFIATRADPVIRDDRAGSSATSAYDFLKGEAPESVNPSLWRQAQLLTKHGLFKVAERIYQVRGFDVSTVTFIVGEHRLDRRRPADLGRGRAGRARPRERARSARSRSWRSIYSHSHGDHFGGVARRDDRGRRRRRPRADHRARRASWSTRSSRTSSPAPRCRAAPATSSASRCRAAPDRRDHLGPRPGDLARHDLADRARPTSIAKTGQEMTIDGVTLAFQLTPGTEAPAEMNFYLPQLRALFMAENANATMHNLLTPRGALVRDAKAWADYLTEVDPALRRQERRHVRGHGIPRFGTRGRSAITSTKHRDAYKYLHDQTVRLMNAGLHRHRDRRAARAARGAGARVVQPRLLRHDEPQLEGGLSALHGLVRRQSGALHALPPERRRRSAMSRRWAAPTRCWPRPRRPSTPANTAGRRCCSTTSCSPTPNDTAARELLADVYTQLGYQAEAGTWRNIYLTGAQELRSGVVDLPPQTLQPRRPARDADRDAARLRRRAPRPRARARDPAPAEPGLDRHRREPSLTVAERRTRARGQRHRPGRHPPCA